MTKIEFGQNHRVLQQPASLAAAARTHQTNYIIGNIFSRALLDTQLCAKELRDIFLSGFRVVKNSWADRFQHDTNQAIDQYRIHTLNG